MSLIGQHFKLGGKLYITHDMSRGSILSIQQHVGTIDQLLKIHPTLDIREVVNNGLTVTIKKAGNGK